MQRIKSVASEYKPWNRDLPWYWVGVQGAIALAAGVYFVVAPDAANSTIQLLLALLLLVCSISDIANGFQNYGNRLVELPMTPFLLVRGGAGAALGLIFFFATRSDYMTDGDARYFLGFGLVAYAIIGLFGVMVSLFKGQMHWMAIGTNLLFLLIGAVLIYNNREAVEAERSVRYLGWAAMTGGAILLIYTYFLRKGQEAEPGIAFQTTSSAAVEAVGAVVGRSVLQASEDAWMTDSVDTKTDTGEFAARPDQQASDKPGSS